MESTFSRKPLMIGLVVLNLAVALTAGAQGSAAGIGAAFRPQPQAVQSSGGAVTTAPHAGAASTPDAAASAADAAEPDPSAGLRVLVISPQRNLASIDGKVVRVGDSLHGMRVNRITPNGVLLVAEDGTRQTLTVAPPASKKPVASDSESKGVRP